MSAAEHRSPPAAPVLLATPSGPHWRALLEARWRARLQEVTELSLAYATVSTPGGAAAADRADAAHGVAGPARPEECARARSLLHRAVAARRKLADVEEALSRLAAGTFGRCEQCGSAIGWPLLSMTPETRYCPRCATMPRQALWC